MLEVRHLGKSFYSRAGLFGKKEFKAVNDVSFKLAKGKTLGLVGESGSGKTTVGLALMRLHEDRERAKCCSTAGTCCRCRRRELMQYKRRIQIVFQNPYASLNPRFTVGPDTDGADADTRHRRERRRSGATWPTHCSKRSGCPTASFFKYPHEFSGGQRQRIAIARCLTMRPDVLICDESVSALDVSVQAQVLNLLQDLQDEFSMSYIFISHDLAVVKYMADQVMVMNEGEIVEIADSDEIYRHPRHAYTKKLLSSIPQGWRGDGAVALNGCVRVTLPRAAIAINRLPGRRLRQRGFCASTIFFGWHWRRFFLTAGLARFTRDLVRAGLRALRFADFFGALATVTLGAGRSGR